MAKIGVNVVSVWPAITLGKKAPKRIMSLAGIQGYFFLPLRGLIPENVGFSNILGAEGAWNEHSVANILHGPSWKRQWDQFMNQYTEGDTIPTVLDNLLFGDAQKAKTKTEKLRRNPNWKGLFVVHTPEQVSNSQREAWEVNPGPGIGGEKLLEIRGPIVIDTFHITRWGQNARRVILPGCLTDYVEILAERRALDIRMCHFHITVRDFLKRPFGKVTDDVERAIRAIGDLPHNPPIILEYAPIFPPSASVITTSFVLALARLYTENILGY